MMFSCMNASLGRKDTLQLFQIKKKKQTMCIILKFALFVPPHPQTSPKHNLHVYS